METWKNGRKIVLALAALCLLLALGVGGFAGAVVYFRMERESRGPYVPWEETQAIAFAEQERPFEALVTIHRLSQVPVDYQRRAIRRILPILVRDAHDEAVLRYQETHRYVRNPPPGLNMTSGLDVELAIAQAKQGRMDAAAQTIRGMTRQRDRAAAMKAIALIHLARGERLEALAMARQIPSRDGRAEALGSLAVLMADDSDPATLRMIAEEALALAWSLEESDRISLRMMARVFARLGYYREALDLVADIPPGEWKDYGLSDIAETLAEAGEIALARETAFLATDPENTVYALVGIVTVQIERHDAAGASRTFALLPAGVNRESAVGSATIGYHLDFQFGQWDPHIAATLLDFADLVAEAGDDPFVLRHCLLGDALAAGDLAIAARAWAATEGDHYRPSFWKMGELLLHGRRLCRAMA